MSYEHVIAFLVGVVATARIGRLVVDDDFPPMVWLREKYILAVPESWGMLVECPFCITVYIATVNLTWAWVSDLHWTWWFGNLLAAGCYLAAMIVVRDVPPETRE